MIMKSLAPVRPPLLPEELPESTLTTLQSSDHLENVRVVGSVLSGIDAKAISLETVVFEQVEISSSKLKKSSLSDVVFVDGLLFGDDFDGSGWLRVEFRKGMYSGLAATDCSLQDVCFDSAKLNIANFRASTLKRVMFRGCDLLEADFQGVSMTDVTFERCNLSGAEFSNSKMVRVDMRSSDVATIKGASSLRGATISTAQLLSVSGSLAADLGLSIED